VSHELTPRPPHAQSGVAFTELGQRDPSRLIPVRLEPHTNENLTSLNVFGRRLSDLTND
jgi:hypothetical protein